MVTNFSPQTVYFDGYEYSLIPNYQGGPKNIVCQTEKFFDENNNFESLVSDRRCIKTYLPPIHNEKSAD